MIFYLFSLILTSGLFANEDIVGKNRQTTSVPETYHFLSPLQGQDIPYPEPIFQQVLINDLKIFMESLARGYHDYFPDEKQSIKAVVDALDSYFSYDDNETRFLRVNGTFSFRVTAQDDDGFPLPLGKNGTHIVSYGQLAGRETNLENSIAGNHKTDGKTNLVRGELKGWNTDIMDGLALSSLDREGRGDSHVEPEDFVLMLFQTTASLAVSGEEFWVPNGEEKPQHITEAFITEKGLDLAQLVQKFLHGAVSFSIAATHHLAFEWDTVKSDEDRLQGAYHWDQAFGYFGASRDFMNYKGRGDFDENGDGFIDIYREKVFGVGKNTVRFDLYSKPSENFQKNSFKAFVRGRHLLSIPGEEAVTRQMAAVALKEWEKTMAATVIHYLNSTIKQMDAYGTKAYSFKRHAKYWAEMKGYALATQFSSSSLLSDEDFDLFHLIVGDHPVLGDQEGFDDYREHLLEARRIFTTPYEFSKYNVENW